MIDREIYEAEELDAYVELCQAGQPAELPPDLPLDERGLVDWLLGISTIDRPDVQFLDDLEKRIYEAARHYTQTKTSAW